MGACLGRQKTSNEEGHVGEGHTNFQEIKCKENYFVQDLNSISLKEFVADVKVLRFSGTSKMWNPLGAEPVVRGLQVVDRESFCSSIDGDSAAWLTTDWVRCQVLGEGSYGKVYLYQQTSTGVHLAIKLCRKGALRKKRFGLRATALDGLLRGVEIHKKLSHPNVLPLLQVIDDPEADILYMMLEVMTGGDLMPRGVDAGKNAQGFVLEGNCQVLPPEQCCRYVRDILKGLLYLQGLGVVHGDLKPDNVMLKDGAVKISDFGVSELFPPPAIPLMTRSPGTPIYFPPECCEGESYMGPVADMWALGVCTYMWLVGCLPYQPQGSQYSQLHHQILTKPLDIPIHLQGSSAEDFLLHVLCIDPEKRYSAKEALNHPWILGVENT